MDMARVFFSRDVIFHEVVAEVKSKPSLQTAEKARPVELDLQMENEECESEKSGSRNSASDPTPPETSGHSPNDDSATATTVHRRSERNRRSPDWFGNPVTYVAADQPACPLTAKEALSGPEGVEWQKAMEKEMKSLHSNEVWDLVELPEGKEANGCLSGSFCLPSISGSVLDNYL